MHTFHVANVTKTTISTTRNSKVHRNNMYVLLISLTVFDH